MKTFLILFVIAGPALCLAKPRTDLKSKADDIVAQAKASFDAAVATGTNSLPQMLQILDDAGDKVAAQALALMIANCRYIHDAQVAYLIHAMETATPEAVKEMAHAVADELPRIVLADINRFEQVISGSCKTSKDVLKVGSIVRAMAKQVQDDLSPLYNLVADLEL